VCINNQRQIAMAAIMYAGDRQEVFPDNRRGTGPWDQGTVHASWLVPDAWDWFSRVGRMDTNSLLCPNRLRDLYWNRPLSPVNGKRCGYYFLWSIPTRNDARPRRDYGVNVVNPFDSPRKSSQTGPYYYLVSDILESGTSDLGNGISGSSYPHTKSGFASSPGDVSPERLGSEGGNVTRPDGSVEWVQQAAMRRRYSLWNPQPNANFTGYW
jgi:hypothetical protein